MPVALFLLVVAVAVAASSDPPPQVLGDPGLHAALVEVLVRGGRGVLETECAAFVVPDDLGGYKCLFWPSIRASRKQMFSGLVPQGTVAVAHTHPGRLFRPSAADLTTAQRLGVPVLVLTPLHIYAAMPDGGSVAVVSQRLWALGLRLRADETGVPVGGEAHQ